MRPVALDLDDVNIEVFCLAFILLIPQSMNYSPLVSMLAPLIR